MTRSTTHLLLYGLRVDSEVPLDQRRRVPADAPADVVIRVGETVVVDDGPPAGRPLLDLPPGRHRYAAAARADGGYTLRCYGTCDFEVDANLRDVTVHAAAGTEGIVAVLTTGMLLSFLLTLRGEAVLHASAVEVGARAVAFVGASSMGKSTVAALMCAAGGLLVTDDVLRVELDREHGSLPSCHVGTDELRIRKSAEDLLALFDGDVPVRPTADGRSALRLPGPAVTTLPLAAVVVPVPVHGTGQRTPTVERLDPGQALLMLVRFPRLLGWRDPEVVERQFHDLGEIVERVPVHVATLPWGPPFPSGLAATISAGVDLGRGLP